jgi:hypothetical protein
MFALTKRHQIVIGLTLVMLMAVTRGYHVTTFQQWLPSASWAAFFLAGVYLRPAWMLAVLLGEAALLDYSAIHWGGVSDFCVSPAYIALLPAYGALWLGGRWYARQHRFALTTLLPLTGVGLLSAAICEFISSASFYFYSGRFPEPTLIELPARLLKYFPFGLASFAFWIGAAVLVHVAAVSLRRSDELNPAS